MSLICGKCIDIISVKNKQRKPDFVECDTCGTEYHSSYTTLSSSEIWIFAFKKTKRQVKYFCAKCENLKNHETLMVI